MLNLKYKNYLLILLTVVAVFNFLDRFVLSLLLEPIKQELQLSDSQLGFLTGFAFALFYAVAGIPIARWADRGNRNSIISATTALWSAMVALCGFVSNFTQLLLVRVGVAVGEAGCLPPAQSLIADYFDRAERPRAMSIYWMCVPIATIIAYLGGGWLAENFGWRITLMTIGVPGILLAILVKLTLHEPRLEKPVNLAIKQPSLKAVLNKLWQQRTFRHIVTAFCVGNFFGMGISQWLPTFFIRSHDMELGQLGAWLAFVWGAFGLLGNYMGGALTTYYASHRESLQLRSVAVVHVIAAVLYLMVYFSANKYIALACFAGVVFSFSLTFGPIFSAIQSLLSHRIRSVALAMIFMLANLIGFGLGPLATGILSDLLAPIFDKESLRYALALLSPGYLWVAYHYWRAGDMIEEDIRLVELGSETIDKYQADTPKPSHGNVI